MLYSADVACDACSVERHKLGADACRRAIDRYFAAEDEMIHGGNLVVRSGTFKPMLRRFFVCDCDPGKSEVDVRKRKMSPPQAGVSGNIWENIVRAYEDWT
jgi:hypothetical protein